MKVKTWMIFLSVLTEKEILQDLCERSCAKNNKKL